MEGRTERINLMAAICAPAGQILVNGRPNEGPSKDVLVEKSKWLSTGRRESPTARPLARPMCSTISKSLSTLPVPSSTFILYSSIDKVNPIHSLNRTYPPRSLMLTTDRSSLAGKLW